MRCMVICVLCAGIALYCYSQGFQLSAMLLQIAYLGSLGALLVLLNVFFNDVTLNSKQHHYTVAKAYQDGYLKGMNDQLKENENVK